uniref:Cotton fiber protein n=1 Tax=Gossypium hirsutum TaxID=3635 RepID=A4GVG5_GOSHI|nr:cotton fiber protein [Gossypium hirsutum]
MEVKQKWQIRLGMLTPRWMKLVQMLRYQKLQRLAKKKRLLVLKKPRLQWRFKRNLQKLVAQMGLKLQKKGKPLLKRCHKLRQRRMVHVRNNQKTQKL